MNSNPNNGVANLLATMAARRKELRMSLRIVADRSGLGIRTVQRVLSLQEPKANLVTVLRIADALNVELRLKELGGAHLLCKRQAAKKAARLASMVQGTSALEAQSIPGNDLRDIKNDIADRLMTGPARQLWSD